MNRSQILSWPMTASLTLAVLSMLVTVQAQPKKRPPVAPVVKKNWEQWRSTVPVSGNVRVGVMSENPGQFDPRAKSFTVFLPASSSARPRPPWLCVDISGQDGRYTASREYDVRSLSRGMQELGLPTDYSRELSDYASGQLAILARLAATCDGPTESFVVASWNGQAPGKMIHVLVNSRLPTTVVAGPKGSLEYEKPCSDLVGQTTSYNLRCEIPAAWLGKGPSAIDVFVRTRRGRSFNPPLPLPIALP